ncbi:pickpocket protein 28-like [Contarinia nasturtii]|uniref:pickpocket protein 28-like n=1 Tax=Contarinia nasturtii TaxID=265458 RepID=UPI0012D39986|nr:pickpocket protein 28-like [Contarinia nasturtii]
MGIHTNLMMEIIHESEHHCSGVFSQGFKVTLSTPGEALQTSRKYFRLPLSHVNSIHIVPEITITTEKLRNFKPSQRKCFYSYSSSERQLYFLKIYTQINCEEECLANFTKNLCRCVKFYCYEFHIYIIGEMSTKICGTARIQCLEAAQKKLQTPLNGRVFRNGCNCMLTCTFIKYKARFNRSPINSWDYNERGRKWKYRHATLVGFAFEKDLMKTDKIIETYTIVDSLAVCRGLLGLFMRIKHH